MIAKLARRHLGFSSGSTFHSWNVAREKRPLEWHGPKRLSSSTFPVWPQIQTFVKNVQWSPLQAHTKQHQASKDSDHYSLPLVTTILFATTYTAHIDFVLQQQYWMTGWQGHFLSSERTSWSELIIISIKRVRSWSKYLVLMKFCWIIKSVSLSICDWLLFSWIQFWRHKLNNIPCGLV